MNIENNYDDEVCEIYEEASRVILLFKHVYHFTVLHYLGDLSGKSILDVGCGSGIYCRLFKSEGAAKVVGIDRSKPMINSARLMEEQNPLGCQYIIGDAEHDEEIIGQFDIVIAVFVLLYADSFDRLKTFCTFLQKNLKPGGICLVIIRNCLSHKFWDHSLMRYGFDFAHIDKLSDGGYIWKVKLLARNKKPLLEIKHYCLPPEMYEKCFKEVGFKTFHFKKCLHDSAFPDEFWKVYDENQSEVVILAEN